ncbi:hypothetical protein PEC302107_26320 [Pectobacterium araliae]|uniref:hypothetical protein n=1 Tax=Pectobacterium araliae TaxID=3073862 RepID=UPI00208116A4|nr:hypothetical protein PEC302107_26320 [Pectobacterium carotovorum subsp. carotovorum]
MNKSILGTAAIYTVGSIISQIFTFITQVVLMKNTSLHAYGFFGISMEVLILLQMVVGNAFRNFYLQKLRVGDRDVNSLTQYQIINGSLYISLFSCILYFSYGVDLYISLSLTISFLLTSVILPLQAKLLVENKRITLIIKDIITSVLLLMTVFITVVLLKLSIKFVVVIQLIPSLIVSFAYLFIYQKDFFCSGRLKNIFSENFKLEKALLVFMGVFLVNSLHNKLGVFYIKNFSELSFLALYLATFKFINPTLFIQSSLISAYMPKFINDLNFKFDVKVFLTFFVCGITISIGLFLLYPYVISILGLDSYKDSYPIMKIGCWYITIVFIYGVLSNYISVTGGQNYVLMTNCIALFLYAVSVFLLGHYVSSWQLVLLVTYLFVLAEGVISIFYFFYIRKKGLKITPFFLIAPLVIILLNTFICFHEY